VLGLLATAGIFDQYDLYLFSLALKQIQVGLAIPEEQLGYLGSIVRLGALPAFLIAFAADRFGRRRVLLATIVGYTVLTGLTAVAPNLETFVVLQFLARSFAVAEVLLAVVVIAEEFDPGVRGWGIGALGALQACGAGLAAILFALVGGIEGAWRGLYLVGLVPLGLVAWWRRTLPETTHFAAQDERRRALGTQQSLLQPVIDLLRMYPGRFAAASAVVFIAGASGAAAGFFGVKYMQDAHGWTPRAAGLMVFLGGAIAIVGNTAAGRLSDAIGRKRVAVGFALADALLTIAFYNAGGWWLVPIWISMVFASMGAGVTLSALASEMFPTSYRSTASGARAVLATAGATLGLAAESALYGVIGSHWTSITILVSLYLAAPLVVGLWFPETAGRELDEISPERAREA
jgi:putative MFS transporter